MRITTELCKATVEILCRAFLDWASWSGIRTAVQIQLLFKETQVQFKEKLPLHVTAQLWLCGQVCQQLVNDKGRLCDQRCQLPILPSFDDELFEEKTFLIDRVTKQAVHVVENYVKENFSMFSDKRIMHCVFLSVNWNKGSPRLQFVLVCCHHSKQYATSLRNCVNSHTKSYKSRTHNQNIETVVLGS